MSSTRLLLGAGAMAAIAARPRLLNWGASPAERARPLPGDGLIPGERAVSTMATTIAAPPAAVWPWLAQMGTSRAGWYSWDHLDNGGHPSADQLNPLWTHVAEGDRLETVPGRSWFAVVHADPPASLVLRATLDLRGRPYAADGPRPRGFVDARWEFFLERRPDNTTRMLVRTGSAAGPRALSDLASWVFWHPAHVVMQLRQLQRVRERAEGYAAMRASGELHRVVGAGIG